MNTNEAAAPYLGTIEEMRKWARECLDSSTQRDILSGDIPIRNIFGYYFNELVMGRNLWTGEVQSAETHPDIDPNNPDDEGFVPVTNSRPPFLTGDETLAFLGGYAEEEEDDE